jgi:hypothetical protein
MIKHRQAVAIVGNAPPVRFSYPAFAKLVNAPLPKRECVRSKTGGISYPDKLEDFLSFDGPQVKVEPPFVTSSMIIPADNRSSYLFGPVIYPDNSGSQPEYDQDQISSLKDPCFDDSTESHEFEREESLMRGFDNKQSISKLRISYILAFVTFFVGAVCYGYHLYALAQDLKIHQPQPQTERLIKDLQVLAEEVFGYVVDLFWCGVRGDFSVRQSECRRTIKRPRLRISDPFINIRLEKTADLARLSFVIFRRVMIVDRKVDSGVD